MPVQCVLPKEPASSDADRALVGTRYGSQVDSRTQYDTLPQAISNRFDFSVEFKTTTSDGVVFYSSDDKHVDFFSLYMKSGQLVFAFNCGSGTTRIMSDKTYHDGMWHTVVFSRDQKSGQLITNDGEETKTGESPGPSTTMNVISPYYLGGLSPDVTELATKNLEVIPLIKLC